jgi:hypothetical protein
VNDEIRIEARFIRSVYKLSFIATIALTVATGIVCCFAIVDTLQSECAGEQWLEGYRPRDYLSLPLVGAFIIFMFTRGRWLGDENLAQRLDAFEHDALPVFERGSFRISQRMLTCCMLFVGLSAMVAVTFAIAVTHHQTILTDCRMAVAPR